MGLFATDGRVPGALRITQHKDWESGLLGMEHEPWKVQGP